MGVQIPLFRFKTTISGNILVLLHLLGSSLLDWSTQDNTIKGLLWEKSSYVCVKCDGAAKIVAFDKQPLWRRRFDRTTLLTFYPNKLAKMAKVLLVLVSLLFFRNNLLINAAFDSSLILEMAKIVMDNYCTVEKVVGMKNAIEAASSNTDVLNIPDGESLAGLLTAGVRGTISDPRPMVTFEPNYVPASPPKMPPLPPEQLVAVLQTSIKLDILEGNIGYLRIDHILGEEVAEKVGPLLLDLVWNKILPTSALIFDLRYTSTGEVSGIPYIVSYFTEAEPVIHIDSIYDRPSNTTTKLFSLSTLLGERYGIAKPLIVLTSKNTRGIAEDVSYCLKNLKRAIIVGEKTAGGSLKLDKFKIGDTDFYVTVPTAKSVNPITGSTWEITGVTPDVEVNAEDALATAIKIAKLQTQIPAIIDGSAALIADNYAFEKVGADVAEKLRGLVAKGEYNTVLSQEGLETQLSADLKTLSGDKGLMTTKNTPALPPMVRTTSKLHFSRVLKNKYCLLIVA